MELIGKRIKLRPFQSNDYLITVNWRKDIELRKLGQFHVFPVTIENEKEWIEGILKSKTDKDVHLAIEIIDLNKLIGYFNLSKINWISRTASLGIIIADKESRGKGYGREIMELGLNYAGSILNLRKITLEVLETNEYAVRLYKSLKFIKEGFLKDHFFFNGTFHNVIIMSIILD